MGVLTKKLWQAARPVAENAFALVLPSSGRQQPEQQGKYSQPPPLQYGIGGSLSSEVRIELKRACLAFAALGMALRWSVAAYSAWNERSPYLSSTCTSAVLLTLASMTEQALHGCWPVPGGGCYDFAVTASMLVYGTCVVGPLNALLFGLYRRHFTRRRLGQGPRLPAQLRIALASTLADQGLAAPAIYIPAFYLTTGIVRGQPLAHAARTLAVGCATLPPPFPRRHSAATKQAAPQHSPPTRVCARWLSPPGRSHHRRHHSIIVIACGVLPPLTLRSSSGTASRCVPRG
jgi:hypothetical protein